MVKAALAPVDDIHNTYHEMCTLAPSLRAALGEHTGKTNTEATEQVLSALTENGFEDGDGVPRWLRRLFVDEVRLRWSDHLPISVSISMPLPGDAETKREREGGGMEEKEGEL